MAEAEDLLPAPEPAHVPRYCLRCRTPLGPHPLDDANTVSNKCPRCGLMFDPNRPETYAGHRMLFRWRLWVPVLLVAIAAGASTYAIVFQNGTMGYALFFAVPFAVGGFLGYGTRVSFWMTLLLSLLAISCVVFILLAMDLSGIFCGLTLGLVFLLPVLVGCVIGWIIQIVTRDAAWDKAGSSSWGCSSACRWESSRSRAAGRSPTNSPRSAPVPPSTPLWNRRGRRLSSTKRSSTGRRSS